MDTMSPYYFQCERGRLFGIHHEPASGGSRANNRHGVLLCYPGMHEYNVNHWAFRRLAAMLTRQGFHVFRFDYYGTGDSSGESADGSPALWVEDIRTAAEELRDLSDARTLSLVGMRLGAALAYMACGSGLRTHQLVLWEPVVSGEQYVRELECLDRGRNVWFLHASRTHRQNDELLGFQFPRSAREALRAIDLLKAQKPRAKRVHLVVAEEKPDDLDLRDRLRRSNVDCRIQKVAETVGSGPGGGQKALLDNEIPRVIVEALTSAV